MPDNSSFNWTDLINAAVSLLNLGKGSGSTPNFYTAPLTPGEQAEQAAKQNLFNYHSAYTDQFLRGMGNLNPDFRLVSPLAGNQAFMGGIKLPNIDWSKIPSRPSTAASAAPPTSNTPTGLPTNASDPAQNIPGPTGPDPFAGWPDPSNTAHNVSLDDLKQYGPGALKIATALLGSGLPLAQVISYVSSMFGGGQQLPVNDLSGKVDLTPAGTKPGTDYGINFPPIENVPGRVVTVGGNLGDPAHPPPGFGLDNPFDWYGKMYGSGDPGYGNSGGRYLP